MFSLIFLAKASLASLASYSSILNEQLVEVRVHYCIMQCRFSGVRKIVVRIYSLSMKYTLLFYR